ncbi:hypothetical protein LUZ60_012216 [Juncus effusus]|nr:hypothetical protein LUZ60_012216 [Juncus effusus]
MNCISYVPSTYRHVIMRNSLYRFYTSLSICNNSTRTNCAKFSFITPSVQYFSSKPKRARISKQAKVADPLSEKEKDPFYYVVRKCDLIGFCKSQDQVSSLICDPSVGKKYNLRKENEELLVIFGHLVPCNFQQPNGLASLVEETMEETSLDKEGKMKSCIIEFDGASKGNPGKAGAGAILRTEEGKVIAKLCEGLGKTTNNVAEYKSLLLGLKYAFEKGFKKIKVKGDSSLIVKQVKGQWKCRNDNMKDLCDEVKMLKKNFDSFEISHVRREFNSDADVQANLGADLPDGEIHVESSIPC